MISQTIRRKFLESFQKNGHTIVPSSPVIPHDDPTILFTNAGMNQFKDVFLGKSKRSYVRACSSQKCIRVGGKHNDLENVGHTRRHLTFFEMLGNFSFGDYFKEEAIRFAWDIVLNVFAFDGERVWASVFEKDDEAFEIWKKYLPEKRIVRLTEKDNFWAMGDTGPCGPCTELLYDRGPHYNDAKNPYEDTTGERFLEFWNLVFMQYNRIDSNTLENLPKPSVDTGAGLERIALLKMNVDSVYETDVLRSLIAKIEETAHIKYQEDSPLAPAFRVIADHLRCLSFAIADGVAPGNSDRGYVLRKVLRRAVRYGKMLGFEKPFLASILPSLVESMGMDYPAIQVNESRIKEILSVEEEAFLRTLKKGGTILKDVVERSLSGNKIISGDDAFKLKDTYGLPFEEIALLAKDQNLQVDSIRFQELEEEAKERSRGQKKAHQQIAEESLFQKFQEEKGSTHFVGYQNLTAQGTVVGIYKNGAFAATLHEGEEGEILLDTSPFYAEMGGQVGDTGRLQSDSCHFEVSDCKAPFKGLIGHIGKVLKGTISVNEKVEAHVDQQRREKIQNNHTATHLLHAALEKILGSHIKQAGSVVDSERLRFDFTHHKALSKEDIRRIETEVNSKIRLNVPVDSYELLYEDVQKRSDIKQFFGDKYDEKVRVIDMDFSKELCGGTHTGRSGDIGYFRIAKESSIASGVRRIEAVTGDDAEQISYESDDLIEKAAEKIKTRGTQLLERLQSLLEENANLAKELKAFKQEKLNLDARELVAKASSSSGIPFISEHVSVSQADLRPLADLALDKLKSGVVVLGADAGDGKCQLIAKVSDDWVKKGIKASNIIQKLAPIVDGSGGGKDQMATCGGKSGGKIKEALGIVASMLATP